MPGQLNLFQIIMHLGVDAQITDKVNEETGEVKTYARIFGISNEPQRDAKGQIVKDGNGKQIDKTRTHSFILSDQKAEFAKNYLKKGMQVMVIGRIDSEELEINGQKYTFPKLIANQVQLLDKLQDDSKNLLKFVNSNKENFTKGTYNELLMKLASQVV